MSRVNEPVYIAGGCCGVLKMTPFFEGSGFLRVANIWNETLFNLLQFSWYEIVGDGLRHMPRVQATHFVARGDGVTAEQELPTR